MSQILDTAKELRFREHAYDPISVVRFGGLNTDVSNEARSPHEFLDLHNMRHEKTGVPTTRCGIKEFIYQRSVQAPDTGAVTLHDSTLVATCEYVVWHTDQATSRQSEHRFDVKLIWDATAGEAVALLYDRILDDGTHFDITIARQIASEPQGCIMQFGAYLIVSLYDHASYAVWPKALPPGTAQTDWNVEVLGQDISPIPSSYDIATATTGDLIVFQAHDGGNETTMTYDLPTDNRVSGRAKPIELPIPLDAAYLIATDPSLRLTRQFTWANQDVQDDAYPGDLAIQSLQHLEHRGWYYRFIAVREITDAEGNRIKIRSHPSTDMFVRDAIYNPFFWSDSNGKFPNASSGNSDPQWFGDIDFFDGTIKPHPTNQAFLDLQAKWRKYFGSDTDSKSAGGTGGTLNWAAHWLGWRDQPNQHYQSMPPWKVEVPASELKGAPMAIFDYTKFSVVPADTIEIEIYRTAYQGVDPKTRDVDTPLFQPHVYGYVGSLKPAGTFTDDVKIPDFGRNPASYEGYLRGQFSAEVESAFGQTPALVFGNIRTDFQLLMPSSLVQAFAYKEIAKPTIFVPASFTVIPGEDALPHHLFYYAYENNQGFRSQATPIFNVTPSTDTLAGIPVAIAFTFPRGYDPDITNIVLYRSTYNTATHVRDFFEVANVPVDPGTYISYGTESLSSVTLGKLDADQPKFYMPGAIAYSEPDQPWFWKPSSIEVHNSRDPVRRLEVLMGELLVTTDSSNTLTLLRQEKPRSEEETKWIGCVAKNAGAKVAEAAIFLSQDNMYFMVPSRPEKLNSYVSDDILEYLSEKIPGQAPLANIRRASCGYLGRRDELWLHIPSSADLWPDAQKDQALRHKTFVWRFERTEDGQLSIRRVTNYTFDLSPFFEVMNVPPIPAGPPTPSGPSQISWVDRSTFRSNAVIFTSGSDGSLMVSYAEAGKIHTINCDVASEDFQASAYWTMALALDEPSGQKQIRKTELKLKARGVVNIMTGIPKRTESAQGTIDGWDAVRGHIHERAEIYTIRTIRTDQSRQYTHPGIDRALETKGSCVMVRMRSRPDLKGRHRVAMRALTVYIDQKHNHGG